MVRGVVERREKGQMQELRHSCTGLPLGLKTSVGRRRGSETEGHGLRRKPQQRDTVYIWYLEFWRRNFLIENLSRQEVAAAEKTC